MPRALLSVAATLCLVACAPRSPDGRATASAVRPAAAAPGARHTMSNDDCRGHLLARLERIEGYAALPRMQYTIRLAEDGDFRQPGRVFVRGTTDEAGLVVVNDVSDDAYRIVVPGAPESRAILVLPTSDREPQVITFEFETEPEREPDAWWSDW